MRNLGQWNQQDSNGKDHHAIQFTKYIYYVWIINNQIYHNEGDSIQTNTSGSNGSIYASRPHYHYIAGNHMYENYENAIDNKNGYHIIASENRIHGFYNSFKTANQTAFILANDDEGWLSGYEWAIFNEIYDSGKGIKSAPTAALTVHDPNAAVPIQTSGQKTFMLGNLIYDVGTGIVLDGRGRDPAGAMTRTWYEEQIVINNTIVASSKGIEQARANSASTESGTIHIEGNIIYNTGSNSEIGLEDSSSQTNKVLYNVAYRSGGSADISISKLDVNTGNVLNSDPLFIDAASNNHNIQFASPARDITGSGNSPNPYILFNQMYGIDISTDIDGNERDIWDAGALEIQASTPPSSPAGLVITN